MHFKLVVMDDNDNFYTLEEEKSSHPENVELVETRAVLDSQITPDESVDEFQALNTALCFLCTINADSSEVEHFLKRHPEALLLEGAGLLPEDSARYILEQHASRCHCQGLCHKNRKKVFEMVQHGFQWYQSRRVQRSIESRKEWLRYFQKLVCAEGDIRSHRRKELLMRNTLIEASLEFKSYKEELDRALRTQQDGYAKYSALSKLACARSNTTMENLQSHISVLEYQVGVASVNLRTVERERLLLLEHIRDARRVQFTVLKKAFEGVHRHDICSLGYLANSVHVALQK